MKKILVIQLQQVGDVLLSTELCSSIKRSHPDYQVDYLIASFTRGVVDGHPLIDNVISFDKSKGFFYFLSIIKKIRDEKYDIILDALCKPRTALLTFLSGAKEIVSFSRKGRNFFYKKVIPLRGGSKIHTLDMRMDLVRAVGLEGPFNQGAQINLSDSEKTKYSSVLESNGIGASDFKIIFGVTSRRVYKEWPRDNFVKIIDYMVEKYQAKVILFPTNEEMDGCLKLKNESRYSESIYMDLPVKGIRDVACLFHQCDFMIGNDSGPRHIAQALDIPTLSIFSPMISKWGWNPHDDPRFIGVDIQDALGLTEEEFQEKLKGANKENAQELLNLITPSYIIERADKMIEDLGLLELSFK